MSEWFYQHPWCATFILIMILPNIINKIGDIIVALVERKNEIHRDRPV